MKSIVLCAFVSLVTVTIVSAGNNIYTSKYDNIDLDEILASDRLLKNYFNCLMERGSCTPDGKELKSNLPDAIQTECSKCSDKQKQGSEKVLKHLIKNKPNMWAELEAKYDPDGTYQKKYDEQLKKAKLEEE